MRNSTDRFIDKVQSYLKESFTKRAGELGICDIAIWDRGYNAVLDSMTSYPACLTFIESKSLTDITITDYSLVIGIGVAADDNDTLDELGNAWCDILEDSIRSDWSLGGACLDTAMQTEIRLGAGKGIYVIYTILKCSVDIGGFVYGQDDLEVPSVQLEEQAPDEEASANGMPSVRDAAEAGDTGE